MTSSLWYDVFMYFNTLLTIIIIGELYITESIHRSTHTLELKGHSKLVPTSTVEINGTSTLVNYYTGLICSPTNIK